ncbi:hypothetical protein LTR16_000371 [Cryomyces antarcticus]|uniref:Pyrrolo-quinoline quinone repeat domain-containing protein n=1 Tax=Cryomyces antarcticus TaxID=329879 RepID=A0ABR0M957_9PEZI|nr:hypothetical protein LTR39_000239 [Cryomyces antarcticus]KAK5020359.1 hypothetical protein LTR60_000588 [Cryomyces antarcticus]KAK5296659.1 hypothetical protein LTR16_000371 [Cryomyces antarcticus]
MAIQRRIVIQHRKEAQYLDSTPQAGGSDWSGWGGNTYNNRRASQNTAVDSSVVGSLTQKCQIKYHLGISAAPTVSGSMVYYPTWDGEMVALDYETCQVQWTISAADIITKVTQSSVPVAIQSLIAAVSRTSPQVDGNVLYFATVQGALLVAVNRGTGALLDTVQVNSHPLALVTMSPTVYQGRVFIGGSSFEEVAAAFVPGYKCCSFEGNFAAYDFDQASSKFKMAWNVPTLPAGQGWPGGSVWGSQPSIDVARSQIFIGTGNLYTTPPDFQACQDETANISVIAKGLVPSTCIPPDVYQDAILAIDIDTGLVNWSRQLSPLDSWTLACGTIGGALARNSTLCPQAPGLDADFGMAPTFVPGSSTTPFGKDTVVIGQKNGNLHALSAQAGTPFWSISTGPDGSDGGISWGIAVDDHQIYFTNINSGFQTWTPFGTSQAITNGAYGAASLVDGSLVWEVPVPMDAYSTVPASVVNDVVFFGRTGQNKTGNYQVTQGGLVAVKKASGAIIKDYTLDANFHGGIAIQNKYVMFGTGYRGAAGSWNGTGSFNVWSV